MVALHAVSGVLIALAYLIIAAAVWTFLRRRRDLDRNARLTAWVFLVFILAAALFDVASVVTLWLPAYAVQGALEAATAVAALATAVVLWRQLPGLLALPSPPRPRPRQPGARPGQRLARDHHRLAHPRARARQAALRAGAVALEHHRLHPGHRPALTLGSTTPGSA